MFERTIILPLADNRGASLHSELDCIRAAILGIAGGYSEWIQRGAWLNTTGDIMYDTSARLTAVVNAAQDRQITALLPEWCAMLRQETLLTQRTQVLTSFIPAAVAVAQ